MKSGGHTIQVALRKRPLQAREIEKGHGAEIVEIINDKQINLLDPDEVNREHALQYNVNKNRFKETHFSFDAIFDENSTNQDVYDKMAAPIIRDLLEGINTTFFAYGATGAGKTYTMVGQKDVPGLMDLMLVGLFENSKQKQMTHDVKIRIAYMEIYNENLKDLLSPESKNLDLREDPKSDITIVHGLTEVEVSDASSFDAILRNGNKNRSKDSTINNEASSRSHGILQIQVECFDRGEGLEREIVTSKLSLVDLAGSERAWANKSKTNKLEGAKINQSLLSLGNCIQALSEISEKGIQKNSFVPFRGSKLTRLLKDSLGGNCRTVMIANISGSMLSFEDTYNTLQYASRAKNIKLHVQKNVVHQGNHVSNYAAIIEKLNRENDNLRGILNNEKVVAMGGGGGGAAASRPVAVVGSAMDHQSQQQMEQLESMIKVQFDDEITVLRSIQETQLKLDKLLRVNQSYMSKNNTAQSDNFTYMKDHLLANNQGIIAVQSQVSEQKQKYSQLQDQRRNVMQRVRGAQLSGKGQQFLANAYAIGEMQSENFEREFNVKILDSKIRERDYEIASLAGQLQLRERILLQQKQLMKQHDLQPDPQPPIIKEASLILATVAPNAIANTQTNIPSGSANSSVQHQYSVDSEISRFGGGGPSSVVQFKQQAKPKTGPNRSSQERGQRPIKNIMSLVELQEQNVIKRQIKARNLSSAKSQQNISKPSQSMQGNIPKHQPQPQQLHQKVFSLQSKRAHFNIQNNNNNNSVSNAVSARHASQKKVNIISGSNNSNGSFINDESTMNQSYSEANIPSPSNSNPYYQNANLNGVASRYLNPVQSALNFDSDVTQRKTTNNTPKVRQRSQRSLSKPQPHHGSLPSIHQKKQFTEYDVHSSPYVQSFKNPEVAVATRKNKLMQLNLNLDHLKDLYTKKYFESP